MNSKAKDRNQSVTTFTDTQNNGSNISSNNESNDNKSDTHLTQPVIKSEVKEKTIKYKAIESRYKQSVKEWVNKRTEDNHKESHNMHNMSENDSDRPPSRNPTPLRNKPIIKKSSTPLSTDNNKSLNLSGISVINKKSSPLKPEIKKYSKPLITERKLSAKRLAFSGDQKSDKTGPLTATRLEVQTKDKEFEESIKRSLLLQTLYLNLKAKQCKSNRKTNALAQISSVWRQTNEMRDQLIETKTSVHSLEEKMQTIDVFERQKSFLDKYLEIRSKVDPLFNNISEMIANQKKVFKIENCSEEDFNKISELLESHPKSERMETIENATTGLKNVEELISDIERVDKELEDCRKTFDKCVNDLEKYERIGNKFSQKTLSIKNLF